MPESRPPSTPAPERTARGERTRRAILDAAVDLFAERGWRGTGLHAVGDAAGVSHAAVLYHFGSSVGLLLAVLDERFRRFDEATAGTWGDDPATVLGNLANTARFNVANPELTKLYVVLKAENLEPDAPAHDYFLRQRRRTHKLYRELVRRGIDEGAFRPDADPDAVAAEITAFIGGAETDYFLDPERLDLVAMYDAFARRLLADLAATAP